MEHKFSYSIKIFAITGLSNQPIVKKVIDD